MQENEENIQSIYPVDMQAKRKHINLDNKLNDIIDQFGSIFCDLYENMFLLIRGGESYIYRLNDRTNIYEEYDEIDIHNDIVKVCNELFKETKDIRLKKLYQTKKNLQEQVYRVKMNLSLEGKKVTDDELSKKYRDYIFFDNGYYLLSKDSFHNYTNSILRLRLMGYNYDKEARCPLFYNFLKEVLEEEDKVYFIKQMIGYCISNDTSKQKAFLLYGTTFGNGKSTLIDIIRCVVGKEYTASVSFKNLFNPVYTQQIVGKKINTCEELSENYTSSADLKSFTSCDPMDVNPKFKAPYTYTPTAKLIVSTNEKPNFSDAGGLMRRLIFIEFNQEFRSEPQEGEKQLIAGLAKYIEEKELPGIFNLAIEGYKSLQSDGDFKIPMSSKAILKEYSQEQNSAYEYITSHFTIDKDSEEGLKFKEIFGDKFSDGYKNFCSESNYKVMGQKTFRNNLKRYFKEHKLTIKNERNQDIYYGLEWINKPQTFDNF